MSTKGHPLPNDVEQLQAMIAAQFRTLAQREAEIAHRDSLLAHRETVIASQHDVIEKQLKKLAAQELQLARLLRRQYGPQKERVDPDQLTLFTAEELTELVTQLQQGVVDSVSPEDGTPENDSAAEGSPAGGSQKKAPRKGHGRRPIPPHIPRETIVHELSGEDRLCPCCGRPRTEISREVSEQLDYIPAELKVLRHERVCYACIDCEAQVSTAPKPPQPIDKGLAGPGLLAYLTLSKYGDYLPLYRLEDIFSRSGILLRRSTLCGWIASVAELLQPLYDLMRQQVLRSHVIHTDDTGIKMLSDGQCQNCKFWTYVGDEANPYAVYEFSLTREGKNPSRFLEDFAGYLQADAFSGYDQVYSKGRVIEVACMAHCRRYWWEARDSDSRRAHDALGYISRLYELETQFEHALLSGEPLRAARQQHAVPLLAMFEGWLKQTQDQVLPKSPIGQAFTYTLNQWQALCRYTDDGALAIDNNLAERMVKLPALLRKNSLFVGSESGGHRAAILLSIIASAKHCGVEPGAWLTAVLSELPIRRATASATGPPDLRDLLPDVWLKTHPEHRWTIDDIRKVERERSRQQKAGKRSARGR
jgi:transposase